MLACLLSIACSSDGAGDDAACDAAEDALAAPGVAAPPAEQTLPPASGGFDYQLGCAYRVPAGVSVVTRDRTARAAPDTYSICYVNAFQTQPDSDWSGPRDALILRDARGRKMRDPGWPDEYLLDISTPERRVRLIAIVGRWITRCAAAGFDAIELDNLDSYGRSQGRLTAAHAEAYAAELVAVAHQSRLSVAQKNAAEESAAYHALGFDFALAEECWKYDECERYTAEYGERVFDVEYDAAAFEQGCRAQRRPVPILRDLELVPPGPGYVRRECP